MSERQKQIQFLKALIGPHPSGECQIIHEKISRAEREERFLRRMIFLLSVLLFLSIAALGYATVLWPELFHARFDFLLKLSCSLGLASLICLFVFTGYWLWHRVLLNGLYNQCRQMVMTSLKERTGPA